jgi:molybdopterin converting factor small subunit
VKVLFYGNLLDQTQGDRSHETKNVSSIKELVDELGIHYGGSFKEFLLGNETCFFLVNGKGIMMTGGLNTGLKPDDRIEVLPFAEAG